MNKKFNKVCRNMVSIILFSLIFTIMLALKAAPVCGEIIYPFKNHLDLKHGTFEIWFKVDVDPNDYTIKGKSARPIMVFLQLKTDKKKQKKKKDKDIIDANIKYFWHKEKLSLGMAANFLDKGKDKIKKNDRISYFNIQDHKLGWNPGEWHYLALTWRRDGKNEFTRELYIDGESIKRQTCIFVEPKITKDTILKIGSSVDSNPSVNKDKNGKKAKQAGKNDSGSLFTVDSFRISKTVRTPEEIKYSFEKGLLADKKTLLLDTFKKAKTTTKGAGKKKKKQKKLSITGKVKPEIGKKGTIVGPHTIVKGKFGNAIKLHTE